MALYAAVIWPKLIVIIVSEVPVMSRIVFMMKFQECVTSVRGPPGGLDSLSIVVDSQAECTNDRYRFICSRGLMTTSPTCRVPAVFARQISTGKMQRSSNPGVFLESGANVLLALLESGATAKGRTATYAVSAMAYFFSARAL